MNSNQVAILILSTQADEYNKFIQAIRKSWKRELTTAGVISYFYSGGHLQDQIKGDNIYLSTLDSINNTARKLKDSIKLLVSAHPHIKLIYRTYLTSYLHIPTFLKFIEQNELSVRSYAGLIGTTSIIWEYFRRFHFDKLLIPFNNFLPKISFANGSGFFIGIEHAKK